MAGRGHQHPSPRLDLLVVLPLGFCATCLPRAALAGEPAAMAAAVGLCLAALLASCLMAGVVWRDDPSRSPWVGRHTSLAGAACAAGVAAAALWARPTSGADGGALGLALCALCAAAGGVALAGVVFAGWLWVGQIAGLFALGAVIGGVAPVGWGGAAGLLAAVAGWSGLALAVSRREWSAVAPAAAALAAGVGALALRWAGLPLELAWLRAGVWRLDAGWTTVWAANVWLGVLVVAALAPTAVVALRPGEQRQWLAALHSTVLLWAAGAGALAWRALVPGAGAWGVARPSPAVWLGAGVLAGGLAADSWPMGRVAIRRAFASGSVAAAALALSSKVVWTPAGEAAALVAGGLLFVAGLLLATPAPAAARAGGQLGPAHAIWLWACGAVAASFTWQALHRARDLPWVAPLSMAGGLAAVALACAAACGLAVSRETLAGAVARAASAWRGERAGTRVQTGRRLPLFPWWFRAIQLVAYLGCLPIWALVWVVSTTMSALAATVQMIGETASGAVLGAVRLIAGSSPSSDATRVSMEGRVPLVELRPTAPWRPSDGAIHARPDRERALSAVDVLSAPFVAMAFAIEYAVKLLIAPGRRRREEAAAALRRARAAPPEAVPETLVIAPPPEVSPGRTIDAEDIRRDSLQRRTKDPRWRAVLRAMGASVLGSRVRRWLSPDVAEPWDERVFRAELVGPGGRRFELFGHAWRSRSRLGCCVTVPTIRGPVDRVVEVSARSREMKDLLESEPEKLKRVLLRAGFRGATMDLLRGLAASRTVVCESPRQDLLEPHQDRQCDLRQEVLAGAYRCRQPLPQDASRGTTNPRACNGCNFPEIWERCANLKLEGTVGIVDQDGLLRRRAHAICRLTGSMAEGEECPKLDCFTPSVITRVIAVDAGRTR